MSTTSWNILRRGPLHPCHWDSQCSSVISGVDSVAQNTPCRTENTLPHTYTQTLTLSLSHTHTHTQSHTNKLPCTVVLASFPVDVDASQCFFPSLSSQILSFSLTFSFSHLLFPPFLSLSLPLFLKHTHTHTHSLTHSLTHKHVVRGLPKQKPSLHSKPQDHLVRSWA